MTSSQHYLWDSLFGYQVKDSIFLIPHWLLLVGDFWVLAVSLESTQILISLSLLTWMKTTMEIMTHEQSGSKVKQVNSEWQPPQWTIFWVTVTEGAF